MLALVSATTLAVTGTIIPAATATAQGEPPPPAALHNVKYTVFAEGPAYLEIYYHDVDPPNWADYSHNPYVFTPKVEADVGPDQQWNLDVQLANPDDWAMVVASGEPGLSSPTSTASSRWTGWSSPPIKGPRARSAQFATGDR